MTLDLKKKVQEAFPTGDDMRESRKRLCHSRAGGNPEGMKGWIPGHGPE